MVKGSDDISLFNPVLHTGTVIKSKLFIEHIIMVPHMLACPVMINKKKR